MEQQLQNNMMLQGTRKRHLPTSEFIGKFNCKEDFVKYFREHCKFLSLGG